MAWTRAKERRKNVRSDLSLPIRVRAAADGTRIESITGDVSEGGVTVQTDLSLPVDAEVRLQIFLGIPAVRIDAIGRVSRIDPADPSDPAGLGRLAIEFTRHADSGWESFRELIAEYAAPGLN